MQFNKISIMNYLLWKFREGKDHLGLGHSGKATKKRGSFKWGLKDE